MEFARTRMNLLRGQVLMELLVAVGVSMILIPAVFSGFMASREGRVQGDRRLIANTLAEGSMEAIRVVRENNWNNIINDGIFHVTPQGATWTLIPGVDTFEDYTRAIQISSVNRDTSGRIVEIGGVNDPATKKVTVTVSWINVLPYSVSEVSYFTNFVNSPHVDTTVGDFSTGTLSQVEVANASGGEVKLKINAGGKGRWCFPVLSETTIDLPDGPPVAVSATSNSLISVPNNVFVATSPLDSTSVKMAYITVPADIDNPTPTLRGNFTLDSSKYSSPSYVPTGIGLDNNFKTNDVKYYKSGSGSVYSLIATNKPDHELIAVQITNGTSEAFQDPANSIYKYKTFFNTRMYQGNNASLPNQDQSPFGYGGTALTVMDDKAYLASGGYLYVIDLSNIDYKSPSAGLDMVGCRIEIHGYDCQPGNGTDRKYNGGQTGTSWSNTTPAIHPNCADGGNIEIYANLHLSPVKVGGNNYIFVAAGAGTTPEFDIVNATDVPSGTSSPLISNSSCGRITTGNLGWKTVSSLDFNAIPGTEEAANSVYAKSDGTRAYMSSNGGVDGNNDGKPDSHQFYVIDTSDKVNPKFLSGDPTTGATSGYYDGDSKNIEMYPKRSVAVLGNQRAILVGHDGVTSNAVNPQDYQVLKLENEASPLYCAGLDFDQGFNDLVALNEADEDTFVYMVASTGLNELKIVQGGPDSGLYPNTGTFESNIFDAGQLATFNSYKATFDTPPATSLKLQFAISGNSGDNCSSQTYDYFGPDGTNGTYFTSNEGSIPFTKSAGKCFRYKAYFETTDTNTTAQLLDFTVNHSP